MTHSAFGAEALPGIPSSNGRRPRPLDIGSPDDRSNCFEILVRVAKPTSDKITNPQRKNGLR